jgi:hypothetical protein
MIWLSFSQSQKNKDNKQITTLKIEFLLIK